MLSRLKYTTFIQKSLSSNPHLIHYSWFSNNRIHIYPILDLIKCTLIGMLWITVAYALFVINPLQEIIDNVSINNLFHPHLLNLLTYT